jgi:16S rRNA C967 or C1407 C5-methylase (RsmB/RsmF family)/NOL1/NOP2/fmu family ribosome biogenesis protein
MPIALPCDFVSRLQTQFPNCVNDFTDALDGKAVLSVRLNEAKVAPVFEQAEVVPWCPTGRYLAERPSFTLDPFFHAGCYYPQEASSMFLHHVLTQILPDTQHAKVLDLCAAPGGKSTLIASYLNGNGLLVANEPIRPRAHILAENLVKWGFPNVFVTQNDPSRFTQLTGLFDVVLVDAPCSGEGMFRKDEKARDEWSLANADLCAARQKRIVADVWPSITEGGCLVYSTCTFNPAENEENLAWLLDQFDAEVLSLEIPDSWAIDEIAVGDGAGYAFYPHKARGEGFFCAVVRKNSAERMVKPLRRDKTNAAKGAKVVVPQGLIADSQRFQIIEDRGQLVAVHFELIDVFHLLNQTCTLMHAALPLGTMAKNDFSPSHALAMSLSYANCFPTIDLDVETALNYLRGDTNLNIVPEKGWSLMRYRNMPLGFIKGIGTRFNNYYPKEWRIRMR